MCCICLEEGGDYIKLNCNHKVHKECFKKLIHYSKTCPMCRGPLFSDIICNCPIYCPYVHLGECRYCFGIQKKDFLKKYIM